MEGDNGEGEAWKRGKWKQPFFCLLQSQLWERVWDREIEEGKREESEEEGVVGLGGMKKNEYMKKVKFKLKLLSKMYSQLEKGRRQALVVTCEWQSLWRVLWGQRWGLSPPFFLERWAVELLLYKEDWYLVLFHLFSFKVLNSRKSKEVGSWFILLRVSNLILIIYVPFTLMLLLRLIDACSCPWCSVQLPCMWSGRRTRLYWQLKMANPVWLKTLFCQTLSVSISARHFREEFSF